MMAYRDRTAEENQRLRTKRSELRHTLRGVALMDLFTDFQRRWDAESMSYYFEGTYSELLVDKLGRRPDAEELIMLVNGSIVHDGAHCIVCNASFKGRVCVGDTSTHRMVLT